MSYFVNEYESSLFFSRYQDKDSSSPERTWEERIRRAVLAVTHNDRWIAAPFIDAFTRAIVLFSSPQMWNFGSTRKFNRAGGSCYTLDIRDNLRSFAEARAAAELVYSASGGTGFRFDPVRPRNCFIANTNGLGIGIMGYGGPLRSLEATTGYITNGGRERGAMMGQLGAKHPDAIEFILSKIPIDVGGGEFMLPLQNCNLSIRIPDCLMRAAELNGPWVFSWFSDDQAHHSVDPWTNVNGDVLDNGIDSGFNAGVKVEYSNSGAIMTPDHNATYRYGVVMTTWEGLKRNLQPNPNNWKDVEYSLFWRRVIVPWLRPLHGTIMAREVLDLLYSAAHHCGDPGVVFEDTYERFNPTPKMGIRQSNVCAEFLSPPNGACNLLSLNLRNIEFDVGLREMASLACRWGNLALDYSIAPVEEINKSSRFGYRFVGIGFMGLAEHLILCKIAYGSDEGVYETARITSEIALSAWEESFKLAKEKSFSTPDYWDADAMESIFEQRRMFAQHYGLSADHIMRWASLMRRVINGDKACNCALISVAPTGSISQIAGFMMSRKAGRAMTVTSGIEPIQFWHTHRKDASGETDIHHDLAPTKTHQPWHVSSADVTPEGHIRMQAAAAAFTCMAVSKTVNLPNSASVRDVRQAYRLAHYLQVPSTAVYRDGSKPKQILTAIECPSGECTIPLVEALSDHTHETKLKI